ncbi:hypothetical protein syc1140_d [Synechococcus elongatus PCC 6301]|uniref:JmjC domain-containing protein n=1 Tax=Synechococcus sp. (strain ATCC 27144 / PCC 6301 / SAUG 1402/1) TaxID=269084 RepID=A0A0H3K5C3_SYNP6|nr:cupin domain-containing protein [Synechococcus elongatus]BAD79330.1 hypothetical protein syc1140_d [Synechococcus elongatus PCC 6301]
MNKLQDLLGSQNLSVFLSHYWAQQSVYIAGDSLRFQSLFSWNHLNDLLNYQTFRESELRFSRDGESLPAGDNPTLWRSRLQEGATLVLNGVHHRVPALKHLATNLRQEFGYRCHINLYSSPAQQQGFDCHYDTHDVLILQIEGEKEWLIYPETLPYPTADQPSYDRLPPEEPPYLQQVLSPGRSALHSTRALALCNRTRNGISPSHDWHSHRYWLGLGQLVATAIKRPAPLETGIAPRRLMQLRSLQTARSFRVIARSTDYLFARAPSDR